MIKIRPAEPDDSLAIAEIADVLGITGLTQAQVYNRTIQLSASDEHRIWVAELDGQIGGWLHALIAHRIVTASFVEIVSLAVAERVQRKGVGRALVVTAGNWAKELEAELRVRTNTRRTAAFEFYKSLGMRHAKSQHMFRSS